MDAKRIIAESDEEPGMFEVRDIEAEDAAYREAEADYEAGRVVPHEEVMKWVAKWGTPDEEPMPAEWLR